MPRMSVMFYCMEYPKHHAFQCGFVYHVRSNSADINADINKNILSLCMIFVVGQVVDTQVIDTQGNIFLCNSSSNETEVSHGLLSVTGLQNRPSLFFSAYLPSFYSPGTLNLSQVGQAYLHQGKIFLQIYIAPSPVF